MTLSTDLRSCLISLYMRLCSMIEIIFNEGQLNRFTKKQIIELFLSQQEQLQKQTTQLEELKV